MSENPQLMFLYACFGALFGILPTILLFFRKPALVSSPPQHLDCLDIRIVIAVALLISAGTWYVGLTSSLGLLCSFALIVVIASYCQDHIRVIYSLAVFSGLIIGATLPWWRREMGGVNLSWVELTIFLAITTIAIWALQIE